MLTSLKMYLYGALVAFYIASCAFVWYKTKTNCIVTGQLKGDEKVITVRENQNEIRNLRPDARALAGQLYASHF